MYGAGMSKKALSAADGWLAANIKAARELAGLTQDQVAQQMQDAGHRRFYQQTMTRVEAAEQIVSGAEMQSLARITGTTMEELLRPPARARQGWALRAAAHALRRARADLANAAERQKEAQRRLEFLIAAARESGETDGVADAEAALREA